MPMTLNAYGYLSVIAASVSVKFWESTVKDLVQFFVLKPTIGKYFLLNKKGFLGAFGCLLNKIEIYECVEVKVQI